MTKYLKDGEWQEANQGFDGYVVPGLVDVHCHGFDGMEVMGGDGAAIGAKLRALGIEWYCPTTVTASWANIRSALQPLAGGFPGFAGVHIEGPFLNPLKAGAQPPDEIRAFDFDELRRELGSLLDLVKIVTLAPDMPGALPLIRDLSAAGIRVSAGHTDASLECLKEARAAGLAQMTHFYSAMRPFTHRDPGCVGFGLTTDIDCELIYDRHHVSRTAAELLWQCRGPRQVLGISDGTKLSGAPDGSEAEMWGHRVSKKNSCVRLQDGTLAGSAVTLVDVFTNLWQDIGKEAAILACSENPRRALGLPEPELWLKVSEDGVPFGTLEGKLPLAQG